MSELSMTYSRSRIPPGTRLNGIFEIEELVAAGGMGEVYKGHNIQTGDAVAIKVMLPEFAEQQTAMSLFRKEASALHNLQHEAIVRYYIFTVEPVLQRPYLAMEFVEGQPLSELLKHGPLTFEAVRALQQRLAAGLQVAHSCGIIHRDVSPDNVIVPNADVSRAKIIDFGIARSTRGGEGTVIGSGFAGKYNYVSPEQLGLFGGDVTGKSDIYSLGLLLVEALTGRPIDMGGSQVDIIEKRRRVPDLGAIDLRIRPMIEQMLQPAPQDRPESMAVIATWPIESAHPVGGRYEARKSRDTKPAATPTPANRRLGLRLAATGALGLLVVGGGLAAYQFYFNTRPVALKAEQPNLVNALNSPTPLKPGEDKKVAALEQASRPPSLTPSVPVPAVPALGANGPVATPQERPTRLDPVSSAAPRRLPPDSVKSGNMAAEIIHQSAPSSPVEDTKSPGQPVGEQQPPSVAQSEPSPPSAPTANSGKPAIPGLSVPPPLGDIQPPPIKTAPNAAASGASDTSQVPSLTPTKPAESGDTKLALATPSEKPESPVSKLLTRPDQITRFIIDFDGGDCFYASPVQVSSNAARIVGLGATVAPFQKLDSAFKSATGFEANIGVKQVTAAQCPALSFLGHLRAGLANAPRITIEGDTDIKSGQPLKGVVDNFGNRHVDLLLVADDGTVQNITRLLKPAPEGKSFFLRMERTGAPGFQPQLLVAVASSTSLQALSPRSPGDAKQLFALALDEANRSGLHAGAAAAYFKLDR